MMIAPRLALLISTIALMACGDDTPPECSPARRSSTMLDPEFVLLEPGSFTMGSVPGTYEYPTMDVTITRPFLLQTTEVTGEEWWRVMNAYEELVVELTNGVGLEHTTPGIDGTRWHLRDKSPSSRFFPEYSVFSVAIGYANARSAIEGYELCYDLSVCNLQEHLQGDLQDGWRILACSVVAANNVDPDCPGYRLPTEAEWEYAARAGAEGDEACEPWPECVEEIAVVGGNRRLRGLEQSGYSGAYPVASLSPNDWCIYDMHGNLPEWTGSFRSRFVSGVESSGYVRWWLGSPLTDPMGLGHQIAYVDGAVGYIVYDGPIPAYIDGRQVTPPGGSGNSLVVKGAFGGTMFDEIRTSAVEYFHPQQLAGFRVVRTAFEVMEERERAGEE